MRRGEERLSILSTRGLSHLPRANKPAPRTLFLSNRRRAGERAANRTLSTMKFVAKLKHAKRYRTGIPPE